MSRDILFIDFETYFDKDYTLKKMRTIDFVRDDRFKSHGASVILNDDEPLWLLHEDLVAYIATLNPVNLDVIAHNTYFDGLILTQQMGFEGCRWYDTLQLARAILPGGHELNLDLNSLGIMLNCGGKEGADALAELKGVRSPSPLQLEHLGEYAITDAKVCKAVWEKLSPFLTPDELALMHMTIRMGVEPRLMLNQEMLEEARHDAIVNTKQMITKAGYDAADLRSNKKFPAILEKLGVIVPTKQSPTTGLDIPALGKNDLEFKKLIIAYAEHMDLFNARMAAKSNIIEKRAAAMLACTHNAVLPFPMPIKYAGAHTWRWSGNDGLNVQNFVRGSKLRLSIEAPLGHQVVVWDLSGIELRVGALLARQNDVLDVVRTGADVYSVTATKHFGYDVDKSIPERQFGKMLDLALGFQMGIDKFQYNAAVGFMGCPAMVLSENESRNAVYGWRNTHPQIVKFWEFNQKMLMAMTRRECKEDYMGLEYRFEAVYFPNGTALTYPNLTCNDDGDWEYGYKRKKKIYGGLFTENIVQKYARDVIAEQMVRVDALPDVRIVSCTHDEIISICPDSVVDERSASIVQIMTTPISWAPDLPLDVDGGYARNYSK